MDISDLRGTVLQRFQELTDEEKGIFDTIMDSPVGTVINKLVGPELEQIFSQPESETEQMLASEESPNYRDEVRNRFGDREPMDKPIEPQMRESFRMGKEPREIDFNRDRPSDMPIAEADALERDMPVEFEGRSQRGNKLPPLRKKLGGREMASR